MTKHPDLHTGALRHQLIIILIGVVIVFFILTPWLGETYQLLTQNLALDDQLSLIAISPLAPTLTLIKSAFFLSIMINIPHIIFRLWRFIQPGLYKNEKKTARGLLLLSSALFYLGSAFAYFISIPLIINFNSWLLPENVQFMLDIENYLNFVILSVFTLGLLFMTPIGILMLVKFNILNVNQLIHSRKYFLLLTFSIAMLITPPDIFSQTIIAIPLYVLYELSILLAKQHQKRP